MTLEIALRREFDYLIPPEFAGRVEVGTRVKVPFGRRQVLGCVTSLAESSTFETLKPILKVIGAQSLVTPRVLELARWMADYYCCAPETALKSVLPDAIRKEQDGWRERLFARVLPGTANIDSLTKRQTEIYHVIEEHRAIALQELLRLTGTTAQTVRKLEDKNLIEIAPQITERDPYANEQIVPTTPLKLNPEQAEGSGKNYCGKWEGISFARRDGEWEDGGLFAGHCAGFGRGERGHRFGAGNFADAANGGTV